MNLFSPSVKIQNVSESSLTFSKKLEENILSARLTLSNIDIQELDNSLPEVAGNRYSEQHMAYIDR